MAKDPMINERNQEIFRLHNEGKNFSELGRMFGISHTQVRRIIKEQKGS